jgi:hypothetical protein
MSKVLSTMVVLIIGCFFVTSSMASYFTEFTKIAEDTISQVKTGKVKDINKLIRMQQRLVAIGKEACLEYAKKLPKDAKLLKLTAASADAMMNSTLSKIEADWHEQGVPKSKGISEIEESSVAGSLYDAVVHPATSYIALKNYKKSKDKALLDQVHAELAEVLHHVSLIK